MKIFIALLLFISVVCLLMFFVAYIEYIFKLDTQQLKRLSNHKDKKLQLMPKLKDINRYTGW